MRKLVESCCTSLQGALAAQARGAGRIELCDDLAVGGVTPARELISEVIDGVSISVNVLVRSVAPGFVCDESTMVQMIADIEFCKSAGAAGIVAGALTPSGAIDVSATQRLIAASSPLPFTFHRAFDVCTEDPYAALETLISLGCTRLLTSGMAADAWDGRKLIAGLVRCAGDRIIVMPGCGVRPDNIDALASFTHASEYHGTRIP